MKRHPAWRKRLETFIDQVERDPFAWGDADCGPNWAGRAVEAVLGIDPAASFRGRYRSAGGALRVLRATGNRDLGDLVSALLEESTGRRCDIHPSEARIGDLMAIADEGKFGCILGICNGERIIVRRPDGKGSVERLVAIRAWRLGDA